MKRARFTKSESALKRRLDASPVPDPSPAIRESVMAAARTGFRDSEARVAAEQGVWTRRRLVLSSAAAALALVLAVAVVMRGSPEATVTPSNQNARTQVLDKPAPVTPDATLLARVDQRLGRARTRLTGIEDVSLRYASNRRHAGSGTLLKRTRKLRVTLARHDVTRD